MDKKTLSERDKHLRTDIAEDLAATPGAVIGADSEKISDLELARLISGEVGENFALAKEAAEESPGYCLVRLEACAN